MTTINLTKDNFDQTVEQNPMVVVDFWAAWCAPCRFFAPTFEQASEQYPDVVFGKVNTEEQAELAGAFGIRSIPTLMILRDKVILYSEAGALPQPQRQELRQLWRTRHQCLRALADVLLGLPRLHRPAPVSGARA